MAARIYAGFIALAIFFTLSGCTRKASTSAPAPVIDAAAAVSAREAAARITEMKGFGDITIVQSGQRMSGKIDAARRNSGYFNAQLYTSFGAAIAVVLASDFRGQASVNRQQFDFHYDDTMEAVPFPAVRHLTYRRFINSLTGSMPDVFWQLPETPDTLIHSRRRGTVTAAWFSDTLTVRAQITPKTGHLATVTFSYDIGGNKFTMRFGNFKKGAPHEIVVRENNRNYITVNYERIVWE